MQIEFAITGLQDVKPVRETVFMEEQGFLNEFDEVDDTPSTLHIAALADGSAIGCLRMFPSEENSDVWYLGRLAVLKDKRKLGLGARLVEQGELAAYGKGARRIELHAQTRAIPFYAKQGYEPFGEEDDDEGVPHTWMGKDL